MLLALVSAPLLVRHLHQPGFGRYVTALAIASIGAGLTEGGVNAIALREFASLSGAARDDAMRGMLTVRLLLSLAGVVGATAFAAIAGYGSTIVIGTAVAGFGLTIQLLQSLLSVPLQGTLKLGWVTVAELIRNAVSTALIVALVLLGAGIVPLLAVIAPACLASLLLTARLVRGMVPFRPSRRVASYLPLVRETLSFAIAVALSSVYYRATVVVMSLEASGQQTGYFSTSFRIVEILIVIPGLVISAAYPIVTRAERDDPGRFAQATRRMFELSILAGVWIAMALELGASFAVKVLGGPEAAPAAPILRIQGLAIMATFVAVACSFPLLSLRRYRALLISNLLGLAVALIVSLSLVPVLGGRGAAIATVVAELSLAASAAFALLRARPDLHLSWTTIPLALAAAGAGVGVGHLVGVHAVLDVAVGTCVYGALLVLFRRFPPEIGHALHARRHAG
jgi:O-antigen/teichoic acid export membrane protein